MLKGIKGGWILLAALLLIILAGYGSASGSASFSQGCSSSSNLHYAPFSSQPSLSFQDANAACSSATPQYCISEADCKSIGAANWCNGLCQTAACTPSAVCGNGIKENGENCDSGDFGGMTCSSYGYDSGSLSCSSDCKSIDTANCTKASCTIDNYWNCPTETECKNAGAYWCDTYCNSTPCPVCSLQEAWYCSTESACNNVGGQWCEGNYCSSECPVCKSDKPWNCNTESACKGVGAQWCDGRYCSSECPVCSKEKPWYCSTQTDCTNAGSYWCTPEGANWSYCSESACPVCSKDEPWNCSSKETCSNAGALWCNVTRDSYTSEYCSNECPVCLKDKPWNCYSESECKGAGAVWCPTLDYCVTEDCPVCKTEKPWYCNTQSDCTGAGGNWCTPEGVDWSYCSENTCPVCSKDDPGSCRSKESCTNSGGYWCDTYCTDWGCPVCEAKSPWYCNTEAECAKTGANWCKITQGDYTSQYCTDMECPVCSKDKPWDCYTDSECKGAGGQWCGTYCSNECPVCSKEKPWYCYSEGECGSIGAEWCSSSYKEMSCDKEGNCTATGSSTTYNYCTEKCPVCSKDEPWNCPTNSECSGVGANWCTFSGLKGQINEFCSSSACPKCEASQPWNCYNESDCKNAEGEWCGNYCAEDKCPVCEAETPWYCNSEPECKAVKGEWCVPEGKDGANAFCASGKCPKCEKDQPWNCSNETDCTKSDGVWCGTYCTNYECPVCSKEKPWYCNTGDDCKAQGANWCTPQGADWSFCSADKCPKCEFDSVWNCYTDSDCAGAKGNWCKQEGPEGKSYEYCSENTCPICSKREPWNCSSKDKCTGAGGEWCGQFCAADKCPVCEPETPWNCSTKEGCIDAKGKWCDNFCTDAEKCPKCEASQVWNCGAKDECEKFKGYWCTSTFVSCERTKTFEFCSETPCAVCTKEEPWNCRAETECIKTGSNWCNDYCYDGPCPECSAEEPWNCYTETDCTSKKANWCEPGGCDSGYCTEWLCPSNEGPVCGDGMCEGNFKEDSANCQKDCGEIRPQAKPACTETKDKKTGMITVECEKEKPVCFKEPEKIAESCKKHGGMPVVEIGADGCYRTICEYEGLVSEDEVFSSAECPPEEKIEAVLKECKEQGMEAVIESGLNGCSYARCKGNEMMFAECPLISAEEFGELEKKCNLGNGKMAPLFDATGCKMQKCILPGEDCPEVPEEAKNRCAEAGGEMVIKENAEGCAVFARCVMRGKEDVAYGEIAGIPDKTALLSLVMKLEALAVEFEKLAKTAKELAEYYKTNGDSENEEKFVGVANLLGTAMEKIDGIKEKISANVDNMDKETMLAIRKDIRYLKDILLEDILYLMLGKKKDGVTDCGANDSCLQRALRICERATAKHVEKGVAFSAEIKGIEGDKCVMHLEADFSGDKYDMTCKLPDYGLGEFDGQNLDKYCKGSLLDKMLVFTGTAEAKAASIEKEVEGEAKGAGGK